jgi:hypothetical protein
MSTNKQALSERMEALAWFELQSNFRKSVLCSLYTDVKSYMDLKDFQIEDIYRKHHKK